MKAAVRYYSRSGHTKLVAEAIAEALSVNAISVDAAEAPIQEPVDVLFVGGALYAYGLDKHVKEYIAALDPQKIGRAAVFSTSWISRHSLDLLKSALAEKGISVVEETFYVKNKADAAQLDAAAAFAKRIAAGSLG